MKRKRVLAAGAQVWHTRQTGEKKPGPDTLWLSPSTAGGGLIAAPGTVPTKTHEGEREEIKPIMLMF